MELPVDQPPMTVADAVADVLIDKRIDRAIEEVLTDTNATQDATVKAIIARGMLQAERETPTVPEPEPEPTAPEPVAPVVDHKRRAVETTYASFDRVAKRLPEDVRLEIGTHYENLAISTNAIQTEYHLSIGVLMAIVKDLGITRRMDRAEWKPGKRFGPGYFSLVDGKRIWMSGRKPTASQRAYEKGLRDAVPQRPAKPAPTPKVEAPVKVIDQSPREPMPTLREPVVAGFEDQPLWLVRIEAHIEVRAERIEDAITQARIKYPHARISGVNLG